MLNIHKDTFVAASADMVGTVTLGAGSSIWFQAVLRGDMAPITVGENCSVQDGCVLHVSVDFPLTLGDYVTVGHGAILHGATLEDKVLVGMGAIILDGAVIGSGSIIGAGALIPEGKIIPPRSLVVGLPGKVVRQLTWDEVEGIKTHAEKYVELWRSSYSQ